MKRDLTSSTEMLELNKEARATRLEAMEVQLACDLARTGALFRYPMFTTALIAGDMVLLDMLHRQKMLNKIPVVFIDTLHLFPETYTFMDQVEEKYGFKAERYMALECENKADWNKKHSSDLYMTDPDEYDKHAKVEPLQRAIMETKTDAWINGRRRDHGADRATLEIFEPGTPNKINPLAFWTFEDCFDYINKHGIPYHPLHDQDFPSIGDLHSTVPVPDRTKWFQYAGERSGRFQGLTNADGSGKTECGIHNFSPKQ
eukprot:CAMPEP_0114249808 /NCGR_PEP_ID=MMETSP0058-20121206/14352_1 /TAXON_ID=36894 /ORGANISM="Pyramimonas parkeae, CCMP726" /LENGTH=258 /DNA_ID=CAMNT_0001363403 /DNA_START=215 /DNA_END=991 /DNA_ORIENTATION=-